MSGGVCVCVCACDRLNYPFNAWVMVVVSPTTSEIVTGSCCVSVFVCVCVCVHFFSCVCVCVAGGHSWRLMLSEVDRQRLASSSVSCIEINREMLHRHACTQKEKEGGWKWQL